MPLLIKYLGPYQPEQVHVLSLPDLGEMKYHCGNCRQTHEYTLADVQTMLLTPAPPVAKE